MRVRHIREKLRQIDGALLEVPPSESQGGGSEGVESFTLFDPEAEEITLKDPLGRQLDAEIERLDAPRSYGDFEPIFEWGPESESKLAQLAGAADERIRHSVEVEAGADALGYYVSFHYVGVQWGITIRTSGLAYLAERYFATLHANAETRVQLAFFAILQHELFHFATDLAVAQGELSQRSPWKIWAAEARRFFGPPYSLREEKLANAWMLRAFRTALPKYRVRGKQAALRSFVARQPPGYRDALNVDPASWPDELHDLIYGFVEDSDSQDDNPLLWGHGYDWAAHFPLWPSIPWQDCVIRLEDDSAKFGVPPGWLSFLQAVPALVEGTKFRKQLLSLGPQVRKRWEALTMNAETAIRPGMNFKPWPPGGRDIYSLRLGGNHRVHVRRERSSGLWIAESIGSHKAMGHG